MRRSKFGSCLTSMCQPLWWWGVCWILGTTSGNIWNRASGSSRKRERDFSSGGWGWGCDDLGGGRALCENEHANEGPNARSSAAWRTSHLCILGLGGISEVLFVNQRGENGEEPIKENNATQTAVVIAMKRLGWLLFTPGRQAEQLQDKCWRKADRCTAVHCPRERLHLRLHLEEVWALKPRKSDQKDQ